MISRRSSFCAPCLKRVSLAEKKALGQRDTLRAIIIRLATEDGYLAPDPLAKGAKITEIEKIPGARSAGYV